MLVSNDVLYIEDFAIYLFISSPLIHSCGMKININARQHSKFLRYRALASTPTTIPPCLETLVAFQYIELSDCRNFLFYLSLQQNLTLYSHFLNHSSTKVLIYNNTNHVVKIPLHHRLGCVTKLPYKSCFATSVDLDVASTTPTLLVIFYDRNGISIFPAKELETELPNGIKIYGNKEAVDIIMQLVNEYSSIWKSSDFVQNSQKC